MAYYKTQVIFHRTTNLPKDDVINTIHTVSQVEGAVGSVATAAAINGYLAAAFYDAEDPGGNLLSFMPAEISRVNLPTFKTYDTQAGGSPLHTVNMLAMQGVRAGENGDLPSEVACCLSFRAAYGSLQEQAGDDDDADTNPERPRSRVRGRLFYGPLIKAAATGSPARPSANLTTSLLSLANHIAGINDAPRNGYDVFWAVHSKELGISLPVVEASVDNAFDTQRRRGQANTARTVQAIV